LSSDLSENILQQIGHHRPQTIKELIGIIKKSYHLTEDEILKEIIKMQDRGLIKLRCQTIQPANLKDYLIGKETLWFSMAIILEVIAALLYFTISKSVYPLAYVRIVLGLAFVLFLPGYALIRTLFPTKMTCIESPRALVNIERIALSFGASCVLVTVTSLLVYFSPFGLNMSIIVIGLLIITSIFLVTALYREYLAKKTFVE
jgi:uncharacterized membrane protein